MTTNERMETGWKNCGPVAMGNAMGINPMTVRTTWPSRWDDPRSDTSPLGLPIDTPWHHKEWLRDNGRAARFHLTPTEALVRAVPGKTVFLLHDPKSPWLGQHWCRLSSVVLEDGLWILDWDGGKTFRTLRTKELLESLGKGWPFCAYTADNATEVPHLTWWQKLYIKITGG